MPVAKTKFEQMTTKSAITTKFLAPTNNRGSRVKVATLDRPDKLTKTFHWDHSKDSFENHVAAAEEFCEIFNWQIGEIAITMNSGFIFPVTSK